MEVLVCVKRVPMVGGKVVVTPDGQDVDTRMSGFAVSPHEECAVEEAVQLTERLGGTVTVLTLGPAAAADQLRDMLALGAGRGVLLETDGREWGPIATAAAIADAARRRAGRLRAKRAVIERFQPDYRGEGLRKELLRAPAGESKQAEILGTGADAVPALVRLFEQLG